MSREIKFRFWDYNTNRIRSELHAVAAIIENPNNYPECELMQYTGLKDKNGKEIYEGDVIEDIKHGRTMRKFVVEDIRLIDREFNNSEHGSVWEVIGNVYQDSHLIVDSEQLKPKIKKIDAGELIAIATETLEYLKTGYYEAYEEMKEKLEKEIKKFDSNINQPVADAKINQTCKECNYKYVTGKTRMCGCRFLEQEDSDGFLSDFIIPCDDFYCKYFEKKDGAE